MWNVLVTIFVGRDCVGRRRLRNVLLCERQFDGGAGESPSMNIFYGQMLLKRLSIKIARLEPGWRVDVTT